MSDIPDHAVPNDQRPSNAAQSTVAMSATNDDAGDEFQRQAEQRQAGIVREFWDFLRYNKKWWLTPIIVVLLAVSVFLVLAATAAAPFIYTLF